MREESTSELIQISSLSVGPVELNLTFVWWGEQELVQEFGEDTMPTT